MATPKEHSSPRHLAFFASPASQNSKQVLAYPNRSCISISSGFSAKHLVLG